ncbi:helix-turn-helix transcriptional regulator [Aminipila butyrica]|uniref:Helix-turn-helix transcriptional regulator n=1 Tax=Aminipila butyrica TaxID=433296 RepID=A0A858BTA1_9FIRM|nr:helix-turn-helix transcriptional regulator [Aminipila butyrica]QIB68582.1 helix-turn-helix transcriptional regulator [Aminipila butyrica]
MGIGNKIREARLRKGLTQEQLAKLVGVRQTAIGNYENNTSHPKVDILYQLMQVLGVDANYIFQDKMNEMKVKLSAPSDTLSVNEKSLVRTYRQCSPVGKQKISSYSQKILDVEKEEDEVDRLMPIAAHNDDMSPEQIELMKQDLEDL